MTDVKQTAERISTERLERIAASDTAHMGEAQRMATELLASRHADAQKGSKQTDTKYTVSDERLDELRAFFAPRPPGLPWRASMDTETLLRELQSLRSSIPGGVGVKRWLVEETLPSGAIRWQCFEHEYQARKWAASTANTKVTPLSALDLSPAEGEPVAWRLDTPEGASHLFNVEDNARSYAMATGGTVTPLYAAPSNPVVTGLPVLTSDLIYAAAVGHYGKRRVDQSGGPDGIAMTVNGEDYNFTKAFRRMWKGLTAALSVKPQSEGE